MLEDLKAFIAVVDKTSLTKAADALSLTQSAVSRRVQQLEEVLGATLLDRSSRPPTATAVGRRVYQAGNALVRDLDRLIGIPKADEEPSGTFRLGLPQMMADVALFDIAVQMKAEFPALDLKCRTEWSTALQLELARGLLDAAVVMVPAGSALPADVRSRFIATLDVRVVQSKHAPIVARRSRMSDLAGHEWILNPQGCGYRAALQRAMEGIGKEVRLGIDMHGTETQLRLVAAGLGLGLAPRSLLSASKYLRELSWVDVPDFEVKLDVWLAHAVELGNLSRTLDVLTRVLRSAFLPDGPSGRRTDGGTKPAGRVPPPPKTRKRAAK